jgi:hypothetical protein
MTRRGFLSMAAAAATSSATPARLLVPIHRILDARARNPPERVQRFWPSLWNEAARDYRQGGIDFEISDGPGEVRNSPADNPIFVGLRRGAINLVVTDTIPMNWDGGRALAGVSTIHDGYHVCMIALRYAHGNQVAFLSVNTCLHEILHVLLQDIFLKSPKWYQSSGREVRVDWYATRLWLFHDGAEVRKSGEAYLRRLRSAHTGSA